MYDIFRVDCKVKVLSSVFMILFGLCLMAFPIGLISEGGSFWWGIASLFGVFCTYSWGAILYNGGMTLCLIVDENNNLYITHDHTSKINNKIGHIGYLKHYTDVFDVNQISNFWKYKLSVNGGTTSEILYIIHNNKKEVLVDLTQYGVKLKDVDLQRIVNYLLAFNPNIQLGKP